MKDIILFIEKAVAVASAFSKSAKDLVLFLTRLSDNYKEAKNAFRKEMKNEKEKVETKNYASNDASSSDAFSRFRRVENSSSDEIEEIVPRNHALYERRNTDSSEE